MLPLVLPHSHPATTVLLRRRRLEGPRFSDDYPTVPQHDDFPAKVQPLASRRICKCDEAKPRNFENGTTPSTSNTFKNSKRTTTEEVRASYMLEVALSRLRGLESSKPLCGAMILQFLKWGFSMAVLGPVLAPRLH